MNIFGLDPVTATVVFTIAGILLQNVVGWLKNEDSFNIRNAAASGIIAFFGSIVVVAGVIGALPDNTDPLVQLTAVATVVATVAGFDTLVKGGARAAAKAVLDRKKSV